MNRYLPAHLCFYLLLTITPLQALEQVELSAEHVIEQELLINELITNLYLLQLNFQDQRAKEELDGHAIQIDEALNTLPDDSHNAVSQRLLSTSKAQWHVINRSVINLLNHRDSKAPTYIAALIHESLKLDRHLLSLRKVLLKERPQVNGQLRFMSQALLMQKLTREYLNLSTTHKTVSSHIKQEQLQAMAKRFNSRLNDMQKELVNHRHAETPVKKASMAWHFIADSIDRFPEKPVPTTVVIYSDRIIRQLSSLHHMF